MFGSISDCSFLDFFESGKNILEIGDILPVEKSYVSDEDETVSDETLSVPSKELLVPLRNIREESLRPVKKRKIAFRNDERKLTRRHQGESIPLFSYNNQNYISYYDITCKIKEITGEGRDKKLRALRSLLDNKKRKDKYVIFMTRDLKRELPDHVVHFSPSKSGVFILASEIINENGFCYEYLIRERKLKFDDVPTIFIKETKPIVK